MLKLDFLNKYVDAHLIQSSYSGKLYIDTTVDDDSLYNEYDDTFDTDLGYAGTVRDMLKLAAKKNLIHVSKDEQGINISEILKLRIDITKNVNAVINLLIDISNEFIHQMLKEKKVCAWSPSQSVILALCNIDETFVSEENMAQIINKRINKDYRKYCIQERN